MILLAARRRAASLVLALIHDRPEHVCCHLYLVTPGPEAVFDCRSSDLKAAQMVKRAILQKKVAVDERHGASAEC